MNNPNRMNGNGHALEGLAEHPPAPPRAPDLTTDYTADLAAARAELAALGVDLSGVGHQQRISDRRRRARDLVRSTAPTRPRWFVGLESLVVSVGNALVLGLMLVISYILPPVAVLGLAYAEIQRVGLGVALFDAPRADLMAVVAVSTYLALLVVQASRANRGEPTARTVWSARLWARRVLYTLGLSRDWKPRGQTTDQQLHTAITRIGWLIILLGTVGTLQTKLTTYPGAWHEAVRDIATGSDLVTALAIAGGCLLTAGLLAGLHFITGFTYDKYTALLPEGADFFALSSDVATAEQRAELVYLRTLLEKVKSDA